MGTTDQAEEGPRKKRITAEALVRWTCALSAVALLAGRGWLHWTHYTQLRVLFWHQGWLEGPLEHWFGISWEHHAATSDQWIRQVEAVLGIFLFLCVPLALLAAWKGGRSKWRDGILLCAGAYLLFDAFLRWVDSGYLLPMAMEYWLQACTPFLLVTLAWWPRRSWIKAAAILVGVTFFGHGLAALGWTAPQPHHFVSMTMKLTSLGEEGSAILLNIVGVLDLLVLPGLFLSGRIRMLTLTYAFTWGMATALARILSHLTPVEKHYGLHPWLAETFVRFPHGLIPLCLIILTVSAARKKKAEQTGQGPTSGRSGG